MKGKVCKKLVALLVPLQGGFALPFGEATLCFALAAAVATSVPCSEPASKMTGMRPEAGSIANLAPGSQFEKTAIASLDEIQRAANRLHRVCYEAIKRHGISRDVQRNIADERFGELNQKLEAGDLAGALKANDEIRSAFKNVLNGLKAGRRDRVNRDSFTGISYAIRDFSNAVEQRVANDSFINEQLKKLRHIIQASAPPDEDSDFVSYREGLLIETKTYLEKGEFGAAYQALQELSYYVPTLAQREYQVILSNIDLAFRRRLENTREYEIARSRSDMIQKLLKRRARNPDEPQSLVVPDEVITPPGTDTGRIRVFEEELSLMPEELQDPIKELAGRANFIDKDAEDEALRVSKDEVQLVCVLASGGLSRRGGIYLNHKRWIEKTLGWIRLGDLRLSQIAQRAGRFKKAALIIVESYFTHRRVNEVLDDARADVSVFGGAEEIRRIKSSLTPIWRLRDGSVHKPYSQDGLGVASHGDLFLQPLLAGAIGDLLNEAGDAKDDVYVSTFNMNAVLSVPSPHLIGDFHNLRKRLKKDRKPVPFVAFQLVPAKGEKGGMLAYIKYNAKKVLQIIEGFLLSDSKKKAMASNPKEYPGFNTNHAVVALNDFVECFFAGTGITAEDLTTKALKNSANFSRVLKVINEKIVVPAGPAKLLDTDFRRKVGTFIEEKTWDGEKIAQVSTMLNALAIFTMRGYDPSVYYLSPRDIDPQKIERRFYGEYKERSQGQGPADSRDNFQRTADIFMEQGLLSLKSGRDGKEWLDKKNIIPGIHFRAGGQITGGRLPARVVLMNGDKIEESFSIPKKADAYALTHALWQGLPDDVRYGDIRVSESDTEIRVEIDVVMPEFVLSVYDPDIDADIQVAILRRLTSEHPGPTGYEMVVVNVHDRMPVVGGWVDLREDKIFGHTAGAIVRGHGYMQRTITLLLLSGKINEWNSPMRMSDDAMDMYDRMDHDPRISVERISTEREFKGFRVRRAEKSALLGSAAEARESL